MLKECQENETLDTLFVLIVALLVFRRQTLNATLLYIIDHD